MDFHAILPVIILEETRFRNYFCMTPSQFEKLLNLIAPFIMKQTVIREPISAAKYMYAYVHMCIYRCMHTKHLFSLFLYYFIYNISLYVCAYNCQRIILMFWDLHYI